MKLFFDNKASEIIQAKVGNLVDNDFLGQVFHDEEVLKETLILFSEKRIYLYPFTPYHNAPLVRARVKKKHKAKFPNAPTRFASRFDREARRESRRAVRS